MTDRVKAEIADGVLELVIDRPAKKNALTGAMYAALADALGAAQADPRVRAILIRSTGELFCAGNDVGEFAAAAFGGGLGHVTRFLQALAGNEKPLVAAVQGRAVGVGTTLLLHCDYVILAADARLTAPFVDLALVPEAASSLLLTARIGHLRAFALFALGEAVCAADAAAWGLANRVVPAGDLLPEAREIAHRLARQPRGALTATKRLMRDTAAILARMDQENSQFAAQLATPEAAEAFTAFAERRPPDFSGFA